MAFFLKDFGEGRTGVSRCDLKKNLKAAGCSDRSLENPKSGMTIEEDRPLSNKASGSTTDVTQIQPQKLHITLRPGQSVESRVQPTLLVYFRFSRVGCVNLS